MVSLTTHGILAIAEIAFFAPAFVISVGLCIKQNCIRNLGWFYMVMISILRLVGASCVLYMETQNSYSSGLQETAAITSAVGTAPLLLALLGLVARVNESMRPDGLSRNVFRPIHLVSLAALILSVVGGINTSKSGKDSYDLGRTLLKVGSVIFFLIWMTLSALAIFTFCRRFRAPSSESKLVLTCVCVLPFLLVRLVYTLAVSFSSPGSIFAYPSPSVPVQASMMFAMEAIVLCFYIIAGLLTPRQVKRIPETEAKDMSGGHAMEG
ncbi:hypothetical protein CERZMDRAFT_90483 [Cercospora zeae-maydis SCOH1-5]|uniref:DUF7702 domain-containing protein n=1 Tax=Cercospora zeae-maydis SCOH1-5 TaxID=717836 RepID=A0A6A6FJW1_9PEZI|nr:hypothetical protein CERZMDRAFT_90483 [Cercospora zeae-maydis SCOH1-5]